MADDETPIHTSFKVRPSILQAFRSAVLSKRGTLYGTINTEVEEALKYWSRVLTGEVKPPK